MTALPRGDQIGQSEGYFPLLPNNAFSLFQRDKR